MGTFFSFFNGDHRHAFFQKPSSAFGVVLISGVEKMLHYIKFIPGSQDQIGFFCGKGEIEAGFLNGVPGILPVIQIKGYCHMIAPCQRDGVKHCLPCRGMGERCARDQKQLVAGEIGLVQLGAVDVQIRAVCSVHQVAAPVRQNFTHGHPGTNAGASQRDMGDIHPLFCQIAGNKSSKLVIRNFTDVSDRKAEPGHGHSGIGRRAAHIFMESDRVLHGPNLIGVEVDGGTPKCDHIPQLSGINVQVHGSPPF